MAKVDSIEADIANLVHEWLISCKIDYNTRQKIIHVEIEQAISEYLSKNIGAEAQAPNIILLRQSKHFGKLPDESALRRDYQGRLRPFCRSNFLGTELKKIRS